MGFQYELSEQFAKSLGLKLRIEVAKSVDEMIQKLLAGEGDMIAYNLPITKEWKDSLLYCGEDVITHQVIVQQGRGKQKPLKDVTELVGKDIYVKPGKYYDRLVNLNSELGGGIRIHEVTNDSTTIEDLITQVAQGKIPYTVADNDLAKLNTGGEGHKLRVSWRAAGSGRAGIKGSADGEGRLKWIPIGSC